ncbi:hypothetical protein ACOSQ4_033118 [Xanthoceras sorbifolium]
MWAAALSFRGFVSVEVVESVAILEGIRLAVEKLMVAVVVESDCMNVVSFCNGQLVSRQDVGNNVLDVQELLAAFSGFVLSFVPRSCNKLAHELAKLAICSGRSFFWSDSFPLWLCSLAKDDMSAFVSS